MCRRRIAPMSSRTPNSLTISTPSNSTARNFSRVCIVRAFLRRPLRPFVICYPFNPSLKHLDGKGWDACSCSLCIVESKRDDLHVPNDITLPTINPINAENITNLSKNKSTESGDTTTSRRQSSQSKSFAMRRAIMEQLWMLALACSR